MKTLPVYFSLGSNLGDRKENIRIALSKMDEAFGKHYSRLSSLLETEPWGFESADRFINCAVLYELQTDGEDMDAFMLGILHSCKAIEKEMGREEVMESVDGRRIYHSRTIDIDILLAGDLVVKIGKPDETGTRLLQIPHPLMEEREFVMVPLREIMKEK